MKKTTTDNSAFGIDWVLLVLKIPPECKVLNRLSELFSITLDLSVKAHIGFARKNTKSHRKIHVKSAKISRKVRKDLRKAS